MRLFKPIILASFFLIFSSFGKVEKVRLEFEILDRTTLEPVIFSEIKLHFNRTKGSKTYEVIRKKSVDWDGKCVLEIEKDIFFNKNVTIQVYSNSMYDTLTRNILINQDIMRFNFELNRSKESLTDTFYVKSYKLDFNGDTID